MNMKLTGALALAICGVLGAAAPRASSAADVKMDVNITNGITILYYDSALTVTIDAATLAAAITVPLCTNVTGTVTCDRGAGAATATVSGTNLVVPFTPVTTPTTGLPTVNAMPLVLQNVWAVRALGGTSANTTVTATVGTNTVLKNGATTSTIVLNGNIGIATGTAPTLSGAATAPVTFADPGLVNAVTGSVILSLDMTNALLSGTYTGAAGQQYTIAVTTT